MVKQQLKNKNETDSRRLQKSNRFLLRRQAGRCGILYKNAAAPTHSNEKRVEGVEGVE